MCTVRLLHGVTQSSTEYVPQTALRLPGCSLGMSANPLGFRHPYLPIPATQQVVQQQTYPMYKYKHFKRTVRFYCNDVQQILICLTSYRKDKYTLAGDLCKFPIHMKGQSLERTREEPWMPLQCLSLTAASDERLLSCTGTVPRHDLNPPQRLRMRTQSPW